MKKFTRQERIIYYAKAIADLEKRLAHCNKRITALMDPDYKEQDWNETVSEQVEKIRKT